MENKDELKISRGFTPATKGEAVRLVDEWWYELSSRPDAPGPLELWRMREERLAMYGLPKDAPFASQLDADRLHGQVGISRKYTWADERLTPAWGEGERRSLGDILLGVIFGVIEFFSRVFR
jgi:hypothetical protein